MAASIERLLQFDKHPQDDEYLVGAVALWPAAGCLLQMCGVGPSQSSTIANQNPLLTTHSVSYIATASTAAYNTSVSPIYFFPAL
jgi:hypothetical protein